MTIDDAEWHQDSVEELGLDDSAAAVHIGVFLAWAGHRHLLAPEHQQAVTAARQRVATPSDHAHTHFVAQFGAWDLTDTGRQFVEFGYDEYLARVFELPALAPSRGYDLPDDWGTYDKVAPLLDEIYARWSASR